MKYIRPIIVFMAIATVMPELATGSTPLYGFLNPVNLIINFLGYGVTVLLIRELFVRYNLNFFGLFLLGLAYVNINEGLIAKTMILESGIPWNLFDHYGYIAGISVPWSIIMSIWHSVNSVMFPVLATHFLFPEVSKEPWLGKKTSIFLALPILFLSIAAFFGEHRGVGTIGQLVLILGNMFIIALIAFRFNKKDATDSHQPMPTKKLIWLGLSIFPFWMLFVCVVLAGLKVPLIILFTVIVLGLMLYIRELKKVGISNDTLLYFILGSYLQTAISGIVLAIFFNPATLGERFPAEIIVLVVTALLIRKVSKRYQLQFA